MFGLPLKTKVSVTERMKLSGDTEKTENMRIWGER